MERLTLTLPTSTFLPWEALYFLGLFAESEAVIRELLEYENRSQFLEEKQLFSIYALIGCCRDDPMDCEGAITQVQEAIDGFTEYQTRVNHTYHNDPSGNSSALFREV